MKIFYIIACLLLLPGCNKKNTVPALVENRERSNMITRADTLPMIGKVIMYDIKTNQIVDTLSLSDIKINSILKMDNYPSSQKDKGICEKWKLSAGLLKEVCKNSEPISSNLWHYVYDHLSCNYEAAITIKGNVYKMNINGGSWIRVFNDSQAGFIGCSQKKCIPLFMSEPLDLD